MISHDFVNQTEPTVTYSKAVESAEMIKWMQAMKSATNSLIVNMCSVETTKRSKGTPFEMGTSNKNLISSQALQTVVCL